MTTMTLSTKQIQDRLLQRRRSAARYYPYLLVFIREFTTGTLAGETHTDDIPFCTEADAASWVATINWANEAGKLDYKVIEHTIVPIWPPKSRGATCEPCRGTGMGSPGHPKGMCLDCQGTGSPDTYKTCTCGKVHSFEAWQELPKTSGDVIDEVERLELRRCPCGSHIAVVTEVF